MYNLIYSVFKSDNQKSFDYYPASIIWLFKEEVDVQEKTIGGADAEVKVEIIEDEREEKVKLSQP